MEKDQGINNTDYNELLVFIFGVHYYDITGLFNNNYNSSILLISQINQCYRLENWLNINHTDYIADFNFGWCGYGRYFCQQIETLNWNSCFYDQERVNLIQQIINNTNKNNSNSPRIFTKENLINEIIKGKIYVNKLLWIDFQYQKDKTILIKLLECMKKNKIKRFHKKLKIVNNNNNNNNNKDYYSINKKNCSDNTDNLKLLIFLEFTVIQKLNQNSFNKYNTIVNHDYPYKLSKVWSTQQYLQFLEEKNINKLNIFEYNDINEFIKNLIESLNLPGLIIKEYIDISLDYEKTLWCWCHRLKQALEFNISYNLNSIYFSYLLQTIALFQQKKLKRYQILLSY
ncbi:hypothetical protein BCR32DRAFT_306638 [Anaeromyces robustus]|uniref:Uncharacterized protein n=1 Tax=Anaeromyces robustus TaxID=1754192 RepID=A0A1Y1VTW5_9FUNG|nr:hypothetical protein BCR32DRAFT_306638 [Anaeromyces robustus]|eukprot:ORX64633.1 hypothetical protein BCR32DRAFT_306638 [Anaeromyces robustus]